MADTLARSRVLPKKKTKAGWSITTINWRKVPQYDFAAACIGLDEAGIRMELENDWTASSGRRVYPLFDRDTHVATEPFDFDPSRPLHCGWDLPVCPAFVPTQINAYGQWCVFPSISPPEDESIDVW